jgi:hypothetical protein
MRRTYLSKKFQSIFGPFLATFRSKDRESYVLSYYPRSFERKSAQKGSEKRRNLFTEIGSKILAAGLLCLCSSVLLAQDQEHKTPQQIEQELQSAEKQFERAKKMFNPWYTGPIITPGATMMPPGWGNMQPYFYLNDNYARFNSHRHSEGNASNLININPSIGFCFGVTKTMDIYTSFQANANWQHDHSGAGFGDIPISLGFPICTQTIHVPAIKLSIKEIFPTGQYQHLDTDGYGLESTGGGSFQTQFTLAASKVMFWDYRHPMNFRMAFSYTLPTQVRVKDFNTYGGGYGTRAKVRPGNTFSADFGVELTLTQNWVIATDLAYTAQNETKYSGHPGVTSSGAHASLGGGFNDNLSIAPAIEYNWNENLGFLGGVWFSVYGRNSSNFVSGIISVTWSFQVQ